VLDGTDIVLIHQLLARYGHAIDQRDWAAFTELFVEDSSIDYRGGTGDVVRNGRDAVVQWFVEVDSRHPAAHHVTNIVVDEHADPDGRVAVHSKFIAPYTREAHHPKRLSGGDYRDVVVRTPSGWRFQHKQCIVRWNVAVRVEVDDVPEHRRTY
jgi:3-phenylpropionate/cinnamic acid dioxygenase small subunit